jgi:tetratricopeptide (TPR) repeat protein
MTGRPFRLLSLAALVAIPALGLGGPGAFAQVDPRTALLEKAGWDALTAGQPQAAAGNFRAALGADPGNARLHFGAGIAAYLERRDADARLELERALALNPRLNEARAILGQAQHRMGDVRSAISTLELFVADARDGVDSAGIVIPAINARATLERWRRELELHDRMEQAIGAHFTVSFEGPSEEALATAALLSLDRAYFRIGALLGAYPTTAVAVVLYTTAQFRDVTRSPSWAAGAYDGTIRVPMRGALDNRAELDRVLAHEFTHALVRTLAARGVPTWLNEGLASALEADDLTWAGERVRDAPARIPLQALQSGFSRLDGAQAQLAYATSALAVRRMLDEAGGAAIANLLRDLGEGVDFEAAFLHRMSRSFSDFQSRPF